MAWKQKVKDKYNKIREELVLAGGQDRINLQHARGKLTARERLQAFFDNGVFNEIEMLSKSQAVLEGNQKKRYLGDGVVCGYGHVNGKTVYAVAEDATISGGASGAIQVEKMCRTIEQAIIAKKPFVMLCESGGARIEEGILSLAAHSRLFKDNTKASGYIPQIAAIMGNCAGGSSYSPAMCDFVFMVDKTGQFFITGPKVIKAVVGTNVSMEELGGASVHSHYSGQAHFVYQDDLSCLEGIKELLEYITVPKISCLDAIDYRLLGKEIENVVPEDKRYPYDVREVIKRIVDRQVILEVLPQFAQNLVTCFARLDGRSIGVVANQANNNGGALDCDAADKCARFVRFCDCFDIPLLTLVDVPGYLPGIEQERRGILRHGSKILYAFAEATVPQVSLILRKAYGGAYCAMDSKALGSDIAFAWPICEFAVMGPGGAVDIIYHKQLDEAEDAAALRAELIKKYEEKYLDPYYAAMCGMVDEVIFPEETREKLIAAFASLENKKVDSIQKKHGNISL
jgi:propionyl-CoA carboxylase beta chain